MRIIEQTEATTLNDDDQFLIDGGAGTRAITFDNLAAELKGKLGLEAIADDDIPIEFRRNLFLGRNLGEGITTKQLEEIGSGKFRGMAIGDFWVAGGSNMANCGF